MTTTDTEEHPVQEYTASGQIELQKNDHLVQPLIAHAEQRGNAPMLSQREGDRFVDISTTEVWGRVKDLSKGLIACGVQPGDRVSIMSKTRLEWVLLDYAILAAGGVTVPIYETSSAEQIEWIISDSGAKVAILEDAALKEKFDEVSSTLGGCEHVFVIDEGGLDDLRQRGADVSDEELDQRVAGITTDDLATIIYTSGTTGRPKGCLLTHGNLRGNVLNTVQLIKELVGPNDSQLLFLPLAHSFAKILCLSSIEQGAKVGFVSEMDKLTEEMPMFRPTYLAAVPRIFEKVFTGAQQRAHGDGKGKIFDKAAEVAEQYSREQRAGNVSLGTKAQHFLFDKLVYGKIRAAFGGQLKASNSGGGPLGERLAHFFNGIGVEIYEGYGLTETSPVLTVNRPEEWKIGTVGKPIPGTTIKIADDGEILAKGPQIFQGYHHNEEATSEAIDPDGWFHTGDIGELDDDGFLRITGRKKEIIVTAAGKNVAPAVLEDRIKRHPLVSQAMVVGDNQKFIAALVTIDEETFPAWAERHGKSGKSVADLTGDEDLRAEVSGAIEDANKAVSRAESVREFRILPEDFSVEGGELTPTLKVKRRVVEDRYSEVINSIYGG